MSIDVSSFDIRPLTSGQEAIWLMTQMSPGRNLYNIQFVWDIPSEVDLSLLKKCLEYLTEFHEAWRTTYHLIDGEVKRVINQDLPLKYEVGQLYCEDRKELTDAIERDFQRPYDLENEASTWWKVYQQPNKKPVLAWFQHHISTDLWSAVVVINQLKKLYKLGLNGNNLLLDPALNNFDDFLVEQRTFTESEKGLQQKSFGIQEFKDYSPSNDLPYDHAKSAKFKYESGYYPFELNEDSVSGFGSLCRENGVQQFNGYLALFHLFLHRLTGNKDIATCTPTAGRDSRYSGIYNYFVNPVLVRFKHDTEMDFESYLSEANKHFQAVLKSKDYPLAQLAREAGQQNSKEQKQICNTSFVWESVNSFVNSSSPLVDWPTLNKRCWDMGDLGVWQRHSLKTQIDEFDITLVIYKFGDKLFAGFEYNAALFKPKTIEHLGDCFNTLLKSVVNSSKQSVHKLPIVPMKKQLQQLIDWNRTKVSYDLSQSLHKRVEFFSVVSPDAIALDCGDKMLSYDRLNRKANQLAHYLLKMGFKAETLVGISLARSVQMYVAVLAVLKAGGAYVPLDPNYPQARLQHIIDDSGVRFCITDSSLANETTEFEKPLLLDLIERKVSAMAPENPGIAVSAEQIAYVIYTSGSTGKPKGVVITHRGYSHLMATQRELFQLDCNQRVLQFSSLSFDASVYSMALAWGVGSALVAPRQEELMGRALIRTLKSQKITTAVLPPSLLMGGEPQDLDNLNTLIVAGEACPQVLAKRWSQGRRFFNAYGPTESTVWATCGELDGSELPTIGRPIANTQVYILDKYGNPVPIGVSGELHIGGDGLAWGYLNQRELTAERFISNPFPGTPGDRIYKSGDLARYRSDGQIEFLGRIDHQVKIRGFRIELGEIEAVCLADSSVKEVLLMTFEQAGSKQLVAYVVPNDIARFNSDILKNTLRQSLPDYMVPAFIVALDKFPLTPNDKIDRRALPEPIADVVEENYSLPSNEIEKAIASVWSEVLGIEKVPLNKNFFDLGGHSLKVAEVFDKLPDELKVQLTLVDLYQHTTVASLAKQLMDVTGAESSTLDKPNKSLIKDSGECQDIAIISTAMRVPGAETPEQFWRNLCEGEESISFFSDEQLLEAGVLPELLEKPYYIKAKGVVNNIRTFDADFFDMTPREAQITDPQQRQFLECAWEALERAGYVGELNGGSIGVFAGVGQNRYYMHHIASHPELEAAIGEMPIALGNNRDFIATRVAYKLHLQGPAMTVQTACSTSLVAVHTAVQALLQGDCDMALAGGVSLGNLSHNGYLHVDGMIGSPDGHTRTFDSQASGTVFSQGSGVVLLKPLAQAKADNDPIVAVIKGSAINNDGAHKAGFTAPSISGQSEVIGMALSKAGVAADSIGYVEAHGTATHIGDPIEITGLTKCYRQETDLKQYCALGSLKTNIGHLDAAAGVTGLIKAAMVVQHGQIPPTLHFKKPNPAIDFSASPFFVNSELIPFPEGDEENKTSQRRAAVSAFGLGGTNAHAVVESHDVVEPISRDASISSESEDQLLVLSAMTPQALMDSVADLSSHIKENPLQSLGDIAYTLRVGRKAFSHRVFVVANSHDSAVEQLDEISVEDIVIVDDEDRQPVFLFPGQGVNYHSMGATLYESDDNFRSDIDQAHALLKVSAESRGIYFSDADLRGETERLHQVELGHPLLFILEYSIAQRLIRAGITPAAMIGHSAGEWVAATIAGVFTLQQAIELMLTRGQLIQTLSEGGMIALPLPADEVSSWLERYAELSLAAINAADQCVVSGPVNQIDALESELQQQAHDYKRVQIKCAGHSSMLDPILGDFLSQLQTFDLKKPSLPFISNLTGKWITNDEATDPQYWVSHLRQPVNYAKGIATLLQSGYRDFVEVGPGRVLTSLTRRCAVDNAIEINVEATLDRHQHDSESEALWAGLGSLWSQGYAISWFGLEASTAKRIVLPTYRFQRQEHWIEPKRSYINLNVIDEQESQANPVVHNRRVTGASSVSSRRANDQSSLEVVTSKNVINVAKGQQRIEKPHSVPVLEKVFDIWRLTLGVSKVKPNDNYFKLGGDSLLAVKALTHLSDAFNIKLSPKVMLEHSSAKKLAAFIESSIERQRTNSSSIDIAEDKERLTKANVVHECEASANKAYTMDFDNIVCLKKGNADKAALVMVHPIGGEVYYYQDLCNNLPDSQPVYAIQSPGLEENGKAYDDIIEMARVYLEELESRLPGQNYILGGASFGGIVALEMGKQLEVTRNRPMPLVMVDTPTPYAIRPYAKFRSENVLEYLLAHSIKGGIELDTDALTDLSLDEQIERVKGICGQAGVELPPLFTKAMIETWMSHQRAFLDYRASDYDGSVLFLRHGETMPNFPRMLHRDWMNYISGDFSAKCISGDHISMNFGDNAVPLGEEVAAFIQQLKLEVVPGNNVMKSA